MENPIKTKQAPRQIVWCGGDSVILHWVPVGLLMVGPSAEYLKYGFDKQPLHLVQELDCVRVVSNEACVVLQRVPPPIESVRGLGSTVAAAMLFDAHEAFIAGEARADESIRAIIDDADSTVLPKAIETCLAAALAEFTVEAQTELLNAAAFGKCFLEDSAAFNVESRRVAEAFKVTAMQLRFLHTLRRAEIAMPLTLAQLNALSIRTVIVRLATVRNMHMLALKLCTYFWKVAREDGYATAKREVLLDWANSRNISTRHIFYSCNNMTEYPTNECYLIMIR